MKQHTKNKTPRYSLVIRCFNEEQHIGKLLAGIMEQTLRNIEIILVDSGSTDATLSIALRYPVKIVNIAPEEFSFGRALNVGCTEATGEIIIIASAHVYPVYNDWLEHMIKPFEDKDVALVYGKQRGDGSSSYPEQQIYKKWFPEDFIKNQDHPFCNNANAAIRKSLWEQVQYNEELTGLEDLDWAKRLIELGRKIVYSVEAEIVHVHNETLHKIYNRYRREAIAFKYIYPHENFNFLDFLKILTVNTVTDYYHAVQDDVFFRNLFSIPSFRLMQFWGTYQGYRQHGSISQQLKSRFYYPNGFFRKEGVTATQSKDRRINYEHH